jgi:hypothetical protein
MGMHIFTSQTELPFICYYSSVFTPGSPPPLGAGWVRIVPCGTPYMGRKTIRVQSVPWPRWSLMAQAWFLLCLLALDRLRITHECLAQNNSQNVRAEKSKNFIDICWKCWTLKIIFYWARIKNSQRHVVFCILISQVLKFWKTQLETDEPCFPKWINKYSFSKTSAEHQL